MAGMPLIGRFTSKPELNRWLSCGGTVKGANDAAAPPAAGASAGERLGATTGDRDSDVSCSAASLTAKNDDTAAAPAASAASAAAAAAAPPPLSWWAAVAIARQGRSCTDASDCWPRLRLKKGSGMCTLHNDVLLLYDSVRNVAA